MTLGTQVKLGSLESNVSERVREALSELAQNIISVNGYKDPVLIEGGIYQGIWLECGPHEGLIYAEETGNTAVALANHEIFFHYQRENGQFPCWIRKQGVGFAQIQMVVPIAFTALRTARLTGNAEFLGRAYEACVKWDHWLSKYRNSRGSGLCEAFCEFDTGHDHSPRFAGLPRKCPNDEAANLPSQQLFPMLPFIAPDLSSTVYQGRMALAEMATLLGKAIEAQQWAASAQEMKELLEKYCYDPEDEFYYDRDRAGNFVRIKGDVITRVFGSHILSQERFDRIYDRHVKSPASFWSKYPLPSIAMDDPLFTGNFSENSWAGASQALTAMRTPEWLEYYGKMEDLRHLMRQWVQAIAGAPSFMQQMNPQTGVFNTSPSYSPCMLTLVRFANRLKRTEANF